MERQSNIDAAKMIEKYTQTQGGKNNIQHMYTIVSNTVYEKALKTHMHESPNRAIYKSISIT
jgi:hypothetical protein